MLILYALGAVITLVWLHKDEDAQEIGKWWRAGMIVGWPVLAIVLVVGIAIYFFRRT
jgi:hypothetical protein